MLRSPNSALRTPHFKGLIYRDPVGLALSGSTFASFASFARQGARPEGHRKQWKPPQTPSQPL